MATVRPDVADVVAHLPGVVRAGAATARVGAARATATLAAHRHSGDSEITVTHGDVDSFVNLDDRRGQWAALSIEFGRSGARGHGTSQGVHALGSAF